MIIFIIQKKFKVITSQEMNDTHFKYCCVNCMCSEYKNYKSIESNQRCFRVIENEREKGKDFSGVQN